MKKKKLSAWLGKIGLLVGFGIMLLPYGTYAAKSTSDIREIKVRFCEEERELGTSNLKKIFFETKPATPTDICFELTNESREEVSLGINFVDGALTADVEQKKACLLEDQKTNFGQYVTGYSEFFTIPAQTTIREIATLTFPDGYAGDSYGCITVHVIDQNQETREQNGQVFQVFSRLGYFLDAFVDGKFVIDVFNLPQIFNKYTDYGKNNLLPLYKNDKNFFIRTEYYNSGNITVVGDAAIGYNYRGFFNIRDHYSKQQILPKQSKILIKKIPIFYTHILGGPFLFRTEYRYSPKYYGINIDTVQQEQTFLVYQKNFRFFIPRGPIAALLLILVILWIRKKRKNASKVQQNKTKNVAFASKKNSSQKKIPAKSSKNSKNHKKTSK